MKTRTNEEWLRALKSDGELQTAALSDLRAYLVRAATYTLHRKRNTLHELASTDLAQLAEDCAQEAVPAILARLDTFRGESRFTTWAYTFAVNAALIAARRERWGRISLDQPSAVQTWSSGLPGGANRHLTRRPARCRRKSSRPWSKGSKPISPGDNARR